MEKIYTLNQKEEIPEYFYIFGNRNNQRFANKSESHNIELRNGQLVSSGFINLCNEKKREAFRTGELDYLPFVPSHPTTIGTISPFLSRIIERYSIEYNLEIYRKYYHPTYPSRLSGVFAFGSYEDCESVSGRNWKLEDVKKYKLVRDEILDPYIKVVKTNFKMIGFLEHVGIERIGDLWPIVGDLYWNGKGNVVLEKKDIAADLQMPEMKCGFLAEYIIEGILQEVCE